MFSTTHHQACRCSLHAQLAERRHQCYRQLAKAILGPSAPDSDPELVEALADHAARLGLGKKVSPFRPQTAA